MGAIVWDADWSPTRRIAFLDAARVVARHYIVRCILNRP